jgi:hypothetical protein
MINTKLQNIIDTKSAIGNAINNKGGSITVETPFYEYAPAIENISTGGGAYSTFVAQAQDNSKYTVYTGYDSQTNPTPNLSNNFAFNRWLLNNSATGDVVLSNVVVAVGGNFNGPNTVTNESNISLLANSSVNYSGAMQSVKINNGFIYEAGEGPSFVANIHKYHESNLVLVGNTPDYGGNIFALAINNGYVYAGGFNNTTTFLGSVARYLESNLAFDCRAITYNGIIFDIVINNGYVYVGGDGNATRGRDIKKYHESNLAFVGNTSTYGDAINNLSINNGFIYAGGGYGNYPVRKYHESNLVFVGNTPNYGATIQSIITNNGFIYVGGQTQSGVNRGISRYYESNLTFDASSGNYPSTGNGGIRSLGLANGFIYASGTSPFGGTNAVIAKYYESNLVLLANSALQPQLLASALNNSKIYTVGAANTYVRQFGQFGEQLEQISFYNITNIKE